jgi:putative DNA-invertase from lambdoid prophage Rac
VIVTSCALYHRVSTVDQRTDNARHQLRAAARRRGLRVVLDVEETGSGARNDRPGLQRVLAAADRGELGAVLVWSVDRFARSTLDLLGNVERLQLAGCSFVAISQGLELRAGAGDAASRLLLQLLAACAEFERQLARERTRVALDARRRRGEPIGRPRGASAPTFAQVRELREVQQVASWRAIALLLGCSVMQARRVYAAGR